MAARACARSLGVAQQRAPRVDEAGNLRWFAGYPVERRVLGFGFVRAYTVQLRFFVRPAYYYVLMVPRTP